MNIRSFTFLLVFIVFESHSSWDESLFNIKTETYHATYKTDIDHTKYFSENQLLIDIEMVKLFDGWGMLANHRSGYIYETKSDVNFHDRYSLISLNSFLSENSNFLLSITSDNVLNSNGLIETNFLLTPESQFVSETNSISSDLMLGNDRNYWNLEFGFEQIEKIKLDIQTHNAFNQDDKERYVLKLVWKISEDSFLTSTLRNTNGTLMYLSRLSSTEIDTSYIGFKTKYLGSSQLSVDVGTSAIKGGTSSLSWKMSHATNLNDYLLLNLSNERRFVISDDFRFESSLNTTTKLDYAYKSISYWGVSGSFSFTDGFVGQEIKSQKTMMNNAFNFSFSELWGGELFVEYVDYQDDRVVYNYRQSSLGVRINRDLI